MGVWEGMTTAVEVDLLWRPLRRVAILRWVVGWFEFGLGEEDYEVDEHFEDI